MLNTYIHKGYFGNSYTQHYTLIAQKNFLIYVKYMIGAYKKGVPNKVQTVKMILLTILQMQVQNKLLLQ